MRGREIKVEIVRAGIRVWDVAVGAGIPYSRLSAILNDRCEVRPNELAAIRAAIHRLSGGKVDRDDE